MDVSCTACSLGPVGIVGHPNLWVRSLNGSEMIFRCEGCEALWARNRDREGQFEWTVMSDRSAMRRVGFGVPPRSPVKRIAAGRS